MKFKIWSIHSKKFLDHDIYVNSEGKLYLEDVMTGELVKAPEDSYNILRYTGLHDIYGQELYEGDIVALYYHHENIVSNQFEISYNAGKWLLDECSNLADYYLDNKKKYGDVCKVVKIKNKYD